MIHEQQTKVRTDEGTAAKSHNGHAGGHARAIGKPLHQSRNRRNVTQTEPTTANHSVTKIDDPKLVPPNAKSRNDKAAAKTQSGGKHGLAWSNAFDPAAENRSGKSEKKNGETENPRERRLRPIIRPGLGDTNDFGERQLENAERVNLSNGKMDGEGCRRKKPAIIAMICDGLLSIKKPHSKL